MELFDYKNTAHDLIEDLVESGMPRQRVYRKIKFFLKLTDDREHLSNMTTLTEVKAVIKLLKWIKWKRIKSGHVVKIVNEEKLLSGHRRK